MEEVAAILSTIYRSQFFLLVNIIIKFTSRGIVKMIQFVSYFLITVSPVSLSFYSEDEVETPSLSPCDFMSARTGCGQNVRTDSLQPLSASHCTCLIQAFPPLEFLT